MIFLEQGNIGPFVELLQLALRRAGYETPINNDFNEDLFNVVKQFQTDNGITSDGKVGGNTWQLLEPYILGYREYTTTAAETIGEIASRYGVSEQVLKTANPNLTAEVPADTIVNIPYDFDLVTTDIRYTYELVTLITRGLAVRYPFIETGSIGKSIMGSDLWYIKIGTGETEVFYNAEHHANEWITTPLLLKFAEEYADAYSKRGTVYNKTAEDLYNAKTLYIIASVNPDGLDVVNGALPVGEYYNNVLAISRNYPQIPFPNGWKANIAGTDLNLNYPANWNKAKETKYALGFRTPAPRDYVGTEPLSAPESKAVYDFTVNHKFKLTLSYHTQGKVIYWKYLDYQPKNSYTIAKALSEASGYSVENTPIASGYAGYKDWFIQAFNLPGYTIEAGLGENPLPLSQFNEIYDDNIGILVTALDLA